MTPAFVLHLYYPDVAVELIDRLAALALPHPVIATAPGPLTAEVQAALDRLAGPVEIVTVPNRGWDIGPLFAILPLLATRGIDLVCKLHTKQGGSGYGAEWRDLCHEALAGSGALVGRIVDAFARDPALDLAGASALYKSAAAHQFRNGERLGTLLPALAAPRFPPSDWGFFAGTMFWARTTLLERLAPVAANLADDDERDGSQAHAIERLFGLPPALDGRNIALVTPDADDPLHGAARIEIVAAPGVPSHDAIVRTLVAKAEANAGAIDAALGDRIADANPLVDYIRHGRDPDALDPNPYFSSTWYNQVNADVYAAGMHPLGHYIHHGAYEDRSTGPLFDMGFYLAAHPQVRAQRLDPLRHFLEHGLAAGASAIPAARPAPEAGEERPRRFYRRFDLARERAFLDGIAALPAAVHDAAAATTVSVVMPVFDRVDRIDAAIRSVLAQRHVGFELLIVDDGSTDGSAERAEAYLGDPRVRLIRANHGGVSAARNRGLAEATGAYVAYLDADNRWVPWFLEVMVRFLVSTGHEAGYSGIAVRDDLDQLAGVRGDDFSWEACLAQNYVDLNAFCHARTLVDTLGGFDTALRRMVDWDLILRYGRDRAVGYAPFVGCEYFDGKRDARRITIAEPAAFLKVVQAKHRARLPGGSAALAAAVPLAFAIKCPAPDDAKEQWGDWHFAQSLQAALQRLGFTAHIDLRDRWQVRPVGQEDVAIVLRGLIGYDPPPGQIAFLWNISHPDQVDYAEHDRFTRVYVASASYAALLRHIVTAPVAPLLQCTDRDRFAPGEIRPHGPEILFCGNSRGVDRDIVRWAIEAGLEPAIFGGGWEERVPARLVHGTLIPNVALGRAYAAAGVVLNDHWPSMRDFGLLSNRLFDVVAAGGRVVSDPVPSIAATFGDAVHEARGPDDLRRTVDALLARAPDPVATRAAADRVRGEHSFDARARQLVADAYAALGLPLPDLSAAPLTDVAPPPDPRLRVHIVAHHAPCGPQSSAYIRLLAPLTDEIVAARFAVTIASPAAPVPPCDVCIVQRTALAGAAAVDALTDALAAMGAALVVDVDDAFALIDDAHPEGAAYRALNATLERAMVRAAECWFSTAPLAAAYAPHARAHAIVPNAIDPRIWRDYRHPREPVLTGERVRLLYMGTHTHAADFAMIRPALDRLADERPGAFELTLVGIAADVAPATWLRRLAPPADAIAYPRFVRWLRAQGPFDVGLAPLADSAFNRAKSDVKLLDYAALGLAVIASDGPAYRTDAATAVHVTLVPDREAAWTDALRALLDDRAAHAARAAALHAHLWAARTVTGRAEQLAARIAAIASREAS